MGRKWIHDKAVSDLFDQGLKGREISKRIGINESTVWAILKRLGKTGTRKAPPSEIGEERVNDLKARLRRYGHVSFDLADLPSGDTGYIAFIGDMPGYACANKLAALKSAMVAVGVK